MASEFPIDDDKLRKLIKASRRIPVAFGYNPGTTDDDDEFLAAHLRKSPDVLGRIALHDGAGTRSAFGTFQVSGTELDLTCERTIKQLAKKFKRYLRSHKIYLNVVVMDPEGNVIDSDVEVLAEAFDLGDDDEAIDALADAPEPEPEADVPDAEEPPAVSPAEIAQRLRALRPDLAAVPPSFADRTAAGFAGVAALLRDGRPEEAERALSKLEMVVARLSREAPAAAAPGPAGPSAAARAPEPADAGRGDPVDARLIRAMDEADERIGDFDGPPAAALRDLLDEARRLLKAGDPRGALAGLRKVQAGIRRAGRARDTWDRAARTIAAPLQAALSAGAAEDLRAAWDRAADLAGSGAHERALRALPAVAEGLRAARAPH
ncbi:MAG TPA: hypothetical protein PKD10_13660 [Paracoccaceae bacterium]|nr:hypothetical protein [Paracoccaceae bacterium]